MNYTPIHNVHALPSERINTEEGNEPFQLTPEEVRVLQACSREGIIARAIPMGLMGAIVGFMGATGGPLKSAKYGAKPAVIGLGFVGYFMGRFSYSRVCFDRALQVPNGTLRKFYNQKKAEKEYVDPSENFYATIEPERSRRDAGFSGSSPSSDIEIPSTSSFDTIPSEYYKADGEPQPRDRPQSYTSYDDLRKQNREEYSKKMFGETVRRAPTEGLVRRPPPSQAQPSEQPGGIRTKYGDVWDA